MSEALAALEDIPSFLFHQLIMIAILSTHPYDDRFLQARGIQPFSSNVHIFRKHEFNTIRHPKLERITFYRSILAQSIDPTVLIALKE